MTKGFIHHNRGAQFRGGKGAFLFIVLFFLGFVAFFLINSGSYLLACFLGVGIVALGLFIIDLRGIQIDLRKRKIREYTTYLWGRKGAWKDIHSFEAVYLTFERYDVKHSSLMAHPSSAPIIEVHDRFLVYLHSATGPHLTLAEFSEYARARAFTNQASKATGLKVIERLA